MAVSAILRAVTGSTPEITKSVAVMICACTRTIGSEGSPVMTASFLSRIACACSAFSTMLTKGTWFRNSVAERMSLTAHVPTKIVCPERKRRSVSCGSSEYRSVIIAAARAQAKYRKRYLRTKGIALKTKGFKAIEKIDAATIMLIRCVSTILRAIPWAARM